MREFRRFLIPSVTLFFCFSVFLPALAQEQLPEIVQKVEPSTVVILTYDKDGNNIGQGSGFFISQSGDIITNKHVLDGVHRAEVKTAKGKVYPIMMIVAKDKEADIIRASVNIPLESVHPLSVSSSIPKVGERVAVIGSPLGLEQTVSDGIVSAVREIPTFGKIYQITAPLSPGSSGSPVVNMKGEVIGVATFQLAEGQNLNFALPGERIAKLKTEKGKTLTEWNTRKNEDSLTSAEGLYNSGLIFLWAGDYEESLPYFEKAIEIDPHYAKAYFQIGYCNANLGRYPEAIDAFKQAIRIKPDYAEAYYNLGVAYGKLGRNTEAIDAYKQAIHIKLDYVEAHNNLGFAFANLGRYPEAIDAFKQAISIKPDYAEAYNNLGVAYGKLGRNTEEINAYKQAIRIKPDDAEAHYNLGRAYVLLGRNSEAIDAFKQAIRIKPDIAEAHYNLGLVFANLGRNPEAINAYKQAIRIKPDDAEAHYSLGRAYVLLGRNPEAIDAFKQAIRIKPDYALAHFILGLTYLLIRDKGSALDQYKILKNLDTDKANQLFNSIYQ